MIFSCWFTYSDMGANVQNRRVWIAPRWSVLSIGSACVRCLICTLSKRLIIANKPCRYIPLFAIASPLLLLLLLLLKLLPLLVERTEAKVVAEEAIEAQEAEEAGKQKRQKNSSSTVAAVAAAVVAVAVAAAVIAVGVAVESQMQPFRTKWRSNGTNWFKIVILRRHKGPLWQGFSV